MPIPAATASPGPENFHRFLVDEDLSPIGVIESVEDVHHCGFSRAVLTQQGVDLARLDGEIDVVIGHERSEHLVIPRSSSFTASGSPHKLENCRAERTPGPAV